MVGNVEAPPNENKTVPNAKIIEKRKNVFKKKLSWMMVIGQFHVRER
jgi:hypothetical protein